MRVKSALWVGAYTRRCFVEGATAVVTRKGSEEAGAIFIIVDHLDGTADLYAPAPQSEFDSSKPVDRAFQRVLDAVPPDAIKERMDRETRFDPDIWIVETEDRAGRSFVETV